MGNNKLIKTVLADDHALVREGIRQFVEKTGEIKVVYEAVNGQEVLDYLSVKHAEIDVVVLDIKMPQLNGIDTAKAIRLNYPEIGVLILSAFDDDPYVAAVLAIGAHGYMLKSATPLELIASLKSINTGQSVISPTIAQKIMGQYAQVSTVSLTDREVEMLALLREGKTNKEIGTAKGISSRTVQSHLANIYRKLDASNRTEAVSKATTLGVLQI